MNYYQFNLQEVWQKAKERCFKEKKMLSII